VQHETSSYPLTAGCPDRTRWYVLALLTIVYALNIADRFMISTLIEPIKAELHLSDSAIGLLTGVALAIFYVTAGLPLALIADRSNRRNLIVAALAAWSLLTAACGLVRSFWQFMFVRILVGIGEAGGTPPSHSLISDHFTWRRRAFALSIYSIGASLGSTIGAMSGHIAGAWGWRAAFFTLGMPGVLIALLIFVTVREPRRGRLDGTRTSTAASGFRATWMFTRHHPTLIHCFVGGGSRMAGLIPEAYASFAEPIFAAFAQPAAVTTEADVAEVVWRAANDLTGQLRFPAGPDAVALAQAR
jgi:MFS family permease